jgi:exonuclease III
LLLVNLQGKPFNLGIIQVYAPTADHSDEETELFCEQLSKAMGYIKSNEVLIIMGDFNALNRQTNTHTCNW